MHLREGAPYLGIESRMVRRGTPFTPAGDANEASFGCFGIDPIERSTGIAFTSVAIRCVRANHVLADSQSQVSKLLPAAACG